MKTKLLLMGCFIMLGTTAVAVGKIPLPEKNSINIKLGLGTGNVEYQQNNNYNYDMSLKNTSVNLEYIASYEQGLELGVGAGITRNSIDDWDENITTIPVYVLARYKWDRDSNWNPYVFTNLGYAFSNYNYSYSHVDDDYSYSNEINGGLYYAVGVGAEYKDNFSIELYWNGSCLNYKRDDYNTDYDDEDYDIEVITLAFGYRLDI